MRKLSQSRDERIAERVESNQENRNKLNSLTSNTGKRILSKNKTGVRNILNDVKSEKKYFVLGETKIRNSVHFPCSSLRKTK